MKKNIIYKKAMENFKRELAELDKVKCDNEFYEKTERISGYIFGLYIAEVISSDEHNILNDKIFTRIMKFGQAKMAK